MTSYVNSQVNCDHSKLNDNYVYSHQATYQQRLPITQQQRIENNFPQTENRFDSNRNRNQKDSDAAGYRQTESVYHFLFVKKV